MKPVAFIDTEIEPEIGKLWISAAPRTTGEPSTSRRSPALFPFCLHDQKRFMAFFRFTSIIFSE